MSIQSPIPRLPVDQLINIVRAGGTVRTGIDIFSKQGLLLLEKDFLVSDVKILVKVKQLGAEWIPIVSSNAGGLWDKDGNQLALPAVEVEGPKSPLPPKPSRAHAKPEPAAPAPPPPAADSQSSSEIDRKIAEIHELKVVAARKYEHAKGCIKQVLSSIQENGGKFDFEPIAETVTDLLEFVANNDKAFSYLTREIFSYDDYLYNHSINVCTIGTVIMKKFNENFNSVVNSFLNNAAVNKFKAMRTDVSSFAFYLPDDLRDISIGFFMHDLGKILIDKEILNKTGALSQGEFEVVKSHSTEKGLELLEKNKLINPYIANISRLHHGRLYGGENRCYPEERPPQEIAPYVKVCKLADIYDAMTSKRCYKEALNPVAVVTDIFHTYAEKDPLLQYILHSFVKSVGIYPAGSIVTLSNGQLAYVLDSDGPTLVPITDTRREPLKGRPSIIVLEKGAAVAGLKINRHTPPVSPLDAYRILPDYLKKTAQPSAGQTAR